VSRKQDVASINDYIKLLRPHQLVKNLFVFLPLFFGGKLGDTSALGMAFLAFVFFSLSGMGVYVFNDLRDADDDRKHPVKRNRPIAAGRISGVQASLLMALCIGLGLGGAACMPGWRLAALLAGYLTLNVFYTLKLKHIAVLDVTCIAVGFVMRVYAGAIAGGVQPSHWIVLMTFLLALFLGLAKRRDDLLLLATSGNRARKSLDGYNLEMVSAAMVMMAAVTIVSYIMYTVSPDVVVYHRSRELYLTTIWVVLGILRYMQVAYVQERSGSPTMVLLKDGFLIATILAWLASFMLIKHVSGL